VQHDEYESKAIEQQTRDTLVSAARGKIFDRNGIPLAVSGSTSMVIIDPYTMKDNKEDPEKIARGLSDILGLSYDTVYEKT